MAEYYTVLKKAIGGADSNARRATYDKARNALIGQLKAVDPPLHDGDPKDFLKTLQPMGRIAAVKDIVDAIVYLTEAGQVTGEVLHVDGGAHIGKW